MTTSLFILYMIFLEKNSSVEIKIHERLYNFLDNIVSNKKVNYILEFLSNDDVDVPLFGLLILLIIASEIRLYYNY